MVVGIIPARYSSTRLPGKPLADIGGKPMIVRTYESASKAKLLDRVIVATDDYRVAEVCQNHNLDYFMTPDTIQTGSDRIACVAKEIIDAEIIVNVQGDEPFIPGMMIDQAIEPLLFDPQVEVSTLVKKISDADELLSTSVVKVVFDLENYAIYFSRIPIPHVRDAVNIQDALSRQCYYKHIGLYVYRVNALYTFTSLSQTDLERLEKLEQLRMIEHGIKIKVVETEFDSISVDTEEDLSRARKYLALQQQGTGTLGL
jgi:3-deoxy-manno-octulosonate cytidylyltransferase (CMP-KDO synthetase)